MELEIGSILDGKVTGIKAFGAFVSLPGGRSGLVHISEVAYSYVNDVTEFLTVGQDVKVKVISVDDNNRINLSIKQTQPAPERPARTDRSDRGERPARPYNNGGSRDRYQNNGSGGSRERSAQPRSNFRDARPNPRSNQPKEPATFEDMMKQFMSESENRQSELNRNSDRGNRRRRSKG